jgi:alpha-glucosidase
MYYGEEIGMENNDPKRIEDVMDPIGRLNWPEDKGRDGERTPMQWNAGENAGFCTVKPWNPVGPRYKQYNVEVEKKDPHSILIYYHNLLKLRHTEAALLDGSYVPLNEGDANVLAYVRSYKNQNILVVLNMSGVAQEFHPDLAAKSLSAKTARTLLASATTEKEARAGSISLQPFEAYIAELK